MSKYRLETISVHGGLTPDPVTGASVVPIYQNSAYSFRDTEHAVNLFSLQEEGYIYTRLGNPTVAVFEQRLAELEGGVSALAVSSGMAAITSAILNLCENGDEIISSTALYGGTYNLFTQTLPKYGIKVKFVDQSDPQNFRAAVTDNTKVFFAETIGNPSLSVLDIAGVADIAHEVGVPLIVDNTFATPILCRPIEHGADIVVHSATKWISGNGTTLGGAIVDGGQFNYDSPRFPGFSKPDPGYNNLVFKDLEGKAFMTKLRVQLLRDIGMCLSPFNAFQFILGLETLHLRMREHVKNSRKLVEWLEAQEAVEWVLYPEQANHPSYALAKKYLPQGAGSIVVFGIKGGRASGSKLIDSVKLWSHLANVGDAKSLLIHPATTTHAQLSPEDLQKAGVSEDLIRLSVGIEHIDDLIADLEQAIHHSQG